MVRVLRGVAIGVAVVVFGAGIALSRVPGGPGALLSGDDASDVSCDDPTPWHEAGQAVGETAAVAGPVADATYEPDVRGEPTFLNLGNPYPDPDRFDVVIFPDVREQRARPPEEEAGGERVCVRGFVDTRDGVPQIVVEDPDDLVVLSDEAASVGPVGADAPVLDRRP